MVNEKALERAKTHDEPYVKRLLEKSGRTVYYTTVYEDMYKHIDLVVKSNKDGKYYGIDVKRSLSDRKNTDNFTLTLSTSFGNNILLPDNEFFAFIDETNNCFVYLIEKSKIKEIVSMYNLVEKRGRNDTKYILLPKKILRTYAEDHKCILESTEEDRKLLFSK